MTPVVRVVGLGPGGLEHVTRRTLTLINESPVVRFRTRRHPGVEELGEVQSYDELYESLPSFEALYGAIVDDLVALAASSASGEVLYVVPGSPVVAERTVELLRERDVSVVLEPAVSIVDAACAALGVDPMAVELQVVDALSSREPFRGPGPLLVLQTYSPEVLVGVADRLAPDTEVTVLHHLGLDDEVITELRARDLATFARADELTSLWVAPFRDGAAALADLLLIVRELRARCPWDQEQTHASLTRHLLEEAYEVIDALEVFVASDDEVGLSDEVVAHVEEELGDLLCQIVFHAELADEEGYFNFATVADTLRDKLIYRHPHVFAGVEVADANDVASRWEVLKRDEKRRESVTDGIAWQLPAITLYTKLVRKAVLVDVALEGGADARQRAVAALAELVLEDEARSDATSTTRVDPAWGDAISAVVVAAQFAGVDLEGVLRERALHLRDAIRRAEGLG